MKINRKSHKKSHVELFLLRNMSYMILLLIILIGVLFAYNYIDLAYSLTSCGALIAFWYWSKRYEQDEEIKLMWIYSKKYKEIQQCKWENIYLGIIDLWYEEFFLYSRWYISKNLWIEWGHWIFSDFQDMVEFLVGEYKKSKKDDITFFLENSICNKLLDFALYGASDINHYANIKKSWVKRYIRRFRNNIVDPKDKSSYYSYSKVNGLNFFDYMISLLEEQIKHTEHLIYVGKIMKQKDRKKYLAMKNEFDESHEELKTTLKVEKELLDYLT